MSNRYACPCCGYKTLDEKPPGTDDICRICYWQDDRVNFEHPDTAMGPNHESLRQSQKNFLDFGAVELRFSSYVRKPTDEDEKDPDWKPL